MAKQKWSGWGSIEGYKTKAGALSSIRSITRQQTSDKLKHPLWMNTKYEMKVMKNPDEKGFVVRYKYPIIKRR